MPLYRNVFGLLQDFGDAELASMIAPRKLLIETAPGPTVPGPSTKDPARKGGAPGSLAPAGKSDIEREYRRALKLSRGASLDVTPNATRAFLQALQLTTPQALTLEIPVRDAARRQRRQFQEMVDYTQRLVRESTLVREALCRQPKA
jgi:hypothetical protein